MELWTVQMGSWRLAKTHEIPLLDITRKTGLEAFSPTWELLQDYKSGNCSESEYTDRYWVRMRETWVSHRVDWEAALDLPQVALACYCKPGAFCHRHLLKLAFEKLCLQRGQPFIYQGELVKNAT